MIKITIKILEKISKSKIDELFNVLNEYTRSMEIENEQMPTQTIIRFGSSSRDKVFNK